MSRLYMLFLAMLIVGIPLYATEQTDMNNIEKNQKDLFLISLQTQVNDSLYQSSYLPLLYNYRQEAEKRNNETHLGNALLLLAKHYYVTQPDSMRYYISLAEPIFLSNKWYEDYFRMQAWDIFVMNREEKKDEVLDAVQKYREMAIELNSPEGLDMIDQALGNFYLSNEMFDDAEQLYNEVLDRMEKRGASVNRKMKLLSLLYNGLDKPEKRLKYLEMANAYLAEIKKEGITLLDDEVPVHETEFSILSAYAANYMETGDMEKAYEYIQKAEKFVSEYRSATSEIELTFLYLDYYVGKEDYRKAHQYGIEAEKFLRDHNFQRSLLGILSLKAKILKGLGQLEDAYDVHEELLILQDSLSRSNFQERFAEMRTKFDVEKLEAEKAQLKLQEKSTRLQMTLLTVGCVILLIAVFGLLYMMRIVKRSQKAYKLAKEKAEEADQMKSTFLANMNHEIRTPLNAIVGFSQVLAEEEDPENKKEYVQIIDHNNELLQQLIGDVLDISKIESNLMSLIYSEQDLVQVMKDIYNTILLRVPESVELILASSPPLTMNIDKNRLGQIMTNFLTNAIKHTKKGFIKFGYEIKPSTVRFYVKDTGEGIPDEQLNTIFDRFIQLENGRKGVGLGLAISKGLVEKMGGKIGVLSTYGKGSEFFFEIPL